jgi:hypothetical protein
MFKPRHELQQDFIRIANDKRSGRVNLEGLELD